MDNEKTSEPSDRSTSPTRNEGWLNLKGLLLEVEKLGRSVLDAYGSIYGYLRHFVLTLKGIVGVRPGQVIIECTSTGLSAIPIMILIGFLMGLIFAMLTSAQLERFGASIYVAQLVATSMYREIGPLLTGILLAGRSSSAFAAEVGTRNINDEVSALETMGLDVHRYLFTPKFLATIFVIPFLSLLTSTLGVLGGFLYSVGGLYMSAQMYANQTLKVLAFSDIMTGCSKAVIYGGIIAIVGCVKGFRVRRGAPQVGHATRSSVVLSIILIIVTDALFTAIIQLS